MRGKLAAVVTTVAIGVAAAPCAEAQTQSQPAQEPARPAVRRQGPIRNPADQLRYQMGMMESVLEKAVEHGFSLWRDRFQAVFPSQSMLLGNAQVRGYRLDGYGVFFDVEVPSLETTWFSVWRTLDQNGLGLQTALNQIRAHIQAAGDANLEQALRRVELQVGPVGPPASDAPGRTVVGASALSAPAATDVTDPILKDPLEAYRAEVKDALVDAMLDHSIGLGLDPGEWLTIGARRNEVRPRLTPGDSDARSMIIRVRGDDLAAFRAGQLSREDAIKRVEVRVF